MGQVRDLTLDLVERVVASRDWDFTTTDDSIIVEFPEARYLISAAGDILVVTGVLDVDVPIETIEDWHRTQPWPTLSRELVGSDWRVASEVAGYFPDGMSEGQVLTLLTTAFNSTARFAESLE